MVTRQLGALALGLKALKVGNATMQAIVGDAKFEIVCVAEQTGSVCAVGAGVRVLRCRVGGVEFATAQVKLRSIRMHLCQRQQRKQQRHHRHRCFFVCCLLFFFFFL
jgi:hypothetical protein